MKPVLVCAAVAGELAGLRACLENPVSGKTGGRDMVSGLINGLPVELLVTGPGIINTAQALTAAMERGKPRLLIQTGCAGTFRESGLRTGDIAVATAEIDVHTGLEPDDGGCLPDPLPFALMTHEGLEIRGRYPVSPDLAKNTVEQLRREFSGQDIRVEAGPFVTVATITATDARAGILWERFQPCMEAMEGAAAAHVALHYETPFLEIRAASNPVGRRDREKWRLGLAFERCCTAVRILLDNMGDCGKFHL